MMRKTLSILAIASAFSCGGASTTSPAPIPKVEGFFYLTGAFDEDIHEQFTGNLTLDTQALGEFEGLASNMSLTGPIGGAEDLAIDYANGAGFSNGTVTTAGAVHFVFYDGIVRWAFGGTLNGGIMSGKDTVSDAVTSFTGYWTATLQ